MYLEQEWKTVKILSHRTHTHKKHYKIMNLLFWLPCLVVSAMQRNQFDTETHTSRIYFPELFLLYNLSVDVSMRTQSSCYLFISFFYISFLFHFRPNLTYFWVYVLEIQFLIEIFSNCKENSFLFRFFPMFFHF